LGKALGKVINEGTGRVVVVVVLNIEFCSGGPFYENCTNLKAFK
jgi:hypothetical protein